jgi:Tfp pilus assembly PilM family ATPase
MIDLKKITSRRGTTATSLLGLSLDGSRLSGVWLKRTNGAVQVAGSFAVTLTLDPLTAAAELVGREIRNHLDAAEIRERRCVVALPLKWALVAQTKLPPLAEADVASFLQLEAERSFPCDVATLITATSRCKAAAGEEHATFIGMPRGHITALEAAFRAAGLKPECFSLGIAALQRPSADAVLTLTIGESHVGLQITHGGGVLVLRALEGAIENTGGRFTLDVEVIAREVRITLGQLPEAVRSTLRRVRVFGSREPAQQLADELQRRLAAFRVAVEVAERYAANEFGVTIPPDTTVAPAFSLVAGQLSGQSAGFDFLPPKVSQWQQFMARYGTGKLRKVGLIAGSVIGLVVAAFLVQQIVLWRYQSRWAGIKTKVLELEATQAKIKQFRPWYDESVRTLSILRQLTQAFPEDGVVTAKTIEIREANLVTCTGTAKDYGSLLRMQENLVKSGNVADLKLNRIQGKAPMQFTFDFRWVEGGASAN